ncbi:hypothetical protein EPUL_004424 [Erysiphe pulchra]|uniref:Reverse transcriptase domain-containing protein n=1 Tax=Erysiphe pulchra TaxID=225359 RepID=A0A2S4PK22_9PEZI|nr:hypothetical protein EPUL_004424 [Erysiphe pulchra]
MWTAESGLRGLRQKRERRRSLGLCLKCGGANHRQKGCRLRSAVEPSNEEEMQVRGTECKTTRPYQQLNLAEKTESLNEQDQSKFEESELLLSHSLSEQSIRTSVNLLGSNPSMETFPLTVDVQINDVSYEKVLVDTGNSCYITVSLEVVKRLKLPTRALNSSRQVQGVSQGCRVQKANMYIIPKQRHVVNLGLKWFEEHQVSIDCDERLLDFDKGDIVVKLADKGTTNSECIQIDTYELIRRMPDAVQVFAASMQDIEKALSAKIPVDPREYLPDYWLTLSEAFEPRNVTTLPPNCPGVDHQMPLETDENGMEKEVPQSKILCGAPVLSAKKPGGGLRFCVDYRGWNAVTKKDRYPISLIRETLEAVGRFKWLTKLDVTSAFHRIRIAEGEVENGNENALWYFRMASDTLLDAGLSIDVKKFASEASSLNYLGYVVEAGKGLRMDPSKIQALLDWRPPTTLKGIRGFLGFANYCRINIPRISSSFNGIKPSTTPIPLIPQIPNPPPRIASPSPPTNLEISSKTTNSRQILKPVAPSKRPVTERPIMNNSTLAVFIDEIEKEEAAALKVFQLAIVNFAASDFTPTPPKMPSHSPSKKNNGSSTGNEKNVMEKVAIATPRNFVDISINSGKSLEALKLPAIPHAGEKT